MGTNENEGSIFVPLAEIVEPVDLPINNTGVQIILNHFYNATSTALIMTAYPESAFSSNEQRIGIILRDAYFRCNVRAVLRAIRHADPTIPTWLYKFNITMHDPQFLVLGDFHSSELRYVFNWSNKYWRQEDTLLSAQMGCYWTNVRVFYVRISMIDG